MPLLREGTIDDLVVRLFSGKKVTTRPGRDGDTLQSSGTLAATFQSTVSSIEPPPSPSPQIIT